MNVNKAQPPKLENKSKDILNESVNIPRGDIKPTHGGSRGSSGNRTKYESVSPQKPGPIPKEPYQPRPNQNTG